MGGAAVEVTIDLSKFGSDGAAQIKKALSAPEVKTAVTSGLDSAAADAGKSGEKAGKASGEGMVTGVKGESAAVTAATGVVAKEAGDEAESKFSDAGHRAASAFGAAAKVALIAGAAAVGVGIAAVFKTGIGEQTDFLSGQAQLAAGLKSTGNAAGTTVDHLEDLASSIQNYSGQTDDSIVASEQLLITFTGIKNAAGPANDILDQTVKISADMAARMGGDASASAIQLGKALNDPVAGIAALSRVGVTFDDGQKKQIASMVAAGNTMGAQKVILAELNKEFGGSAKAAGDTLPGQMARAKRSFEDVSQSVVSAMMPALAGLGNFLTQRVMPAFQTLVNWLLAHWPQIQGVIVGAWNNFIRPALMGLVTVFRDYVIPAVSDVVGYIMDHWPQISKFFSDAWTNYIKPALTALVDFFRNDVIPAVQSVVSFVVAHWPQIQKAFVLLWDTVKPVFEALGRLLTTIWHSVLEPIVAWVQEHWSQIRAVMEVVAIAIGVAFKVAAVVITIAINVITDIIRGMSVVVGFVIDVISGYIRAYAAVVMWLWHEVIEPAIHGVEDVFNAVWSFLQTVWNTVGKPVFDAIASASKTIGDGLTWAYNNVIKPIGEEIGLIWTGIKTGWSDMLTALGSIGEGVWSGIRGVFETLKGIVNTGIRGLNTLIHGINDASGGLSDLWTWSGIPAIPKIPSIPTLALGATVMPRPGGTLALLAEAGKSETVVDTGLMNKVLGAVSKNLDNRPATQGAGGGPTPEQWDDLVAAVQDAASGPRSLVLNSREFAKIMNDTNSAQIWGRT